MQNIYLDKNSGSPVCSLPYFLFPSELQNAGNFLLRSPIAQSFPLSFPSHQAISPTFEVVSKKNLLFPILCWHVQQSSLTFPIRKIQSFSQNIVMITLILHFNSMRKNKTKQQRHILHISFCPSIWSMEPEVWLIRKVAKLYSHSDTGRIEHHSEMNRIYYTIWDKNVLKYTSCIQSVCFNFLQILVKELSFTITINNNIPNHIKAILC